MYADLADTVSITLETTSTVACTSLSIMDDVDFEGFETFTATLTSNNARAVVPAAENSASLVIQDPEGEYIIHNTYHIIIIMFLLLIILTDCTLSFTQLSYSVDEDVAGGTVSSVMIMFGSGGTRMNGDYVIGLMNNFVTSGELCACMCIGGEGGLCACMCRREGGLCACMCIGGEGRLCACMCIGGEGVWQAKPIKTAP